MILTDKTIVGPWVLDRTGGIWTPEDTTAIGLVNTKMVAGVIYDNYNGKSVTCGIAIEGVLTPLYLWTIFDYPFNQLRVNKIVCSIAENNERSIRLVKKMGFVKECQILDAHPSGSLLFYTMTRAQCRFIGERYGKRYKRTACA